MRETHGFLFRESALLLCLGGLHGFFLDATALPFLFLMRCKGTLLREPSRFFFSLDALGFNQRESFLFLLANSFFFHALGLQLRFLRARALFFLGTLAVGLYASGQGIFFRLSSSLLRGDAFLFKRVRRRRLRKLGGRFFRFDVRFEIRIQQKTVGIHCALRRARRNRLFLGCERSEQLVARRVQFRIFLRRRRRFLDWLFLRSRRAKQLASRLDSLGGFEFNGSTRFLRFNALFTRVGVFLDRSALFEHARHARQRRHLVLSRAHARRRLRLKPRRRPLIPWHRLFRFRLHRMRRRRHGITLVPRMRRRSVQPRRTNRNHQSRRPDRTPHVIRAIHVQELRDPIDTLHESRQIHRAPPHRLRLHARPSLGVFRQRQHEKRQSLGFIRPPFPRLLHRRLDRERLLERVPRVRAVVHDRGLAHRRRPAPRRPSFPSDADASRSRPARPRLERAHGDDERDDAVLRVLSTREFFQHRARAKRRDEE